MLSSKDRNGLAVLVTFAGLSLTSVFLLLSGLLVSLSWWNISNDPNMPSNQSRKQTIRPIGLFFLLHLFWELIQAISWFMTLRWALLGDVKFGTFCVVQAILKQLNATGTSLSTIGLSWCILHNYVFQARDLPLKRAFIVLIAMTILQMLIFLVPTVVVGVDKLHQPSGFWCWIPEDQYYTLKYVMVYMFYWTATGFSLLSALAYLASARVNKRLPSGHFWIGFLTRQNGLFRMGFFSMLVAHDREPMFGFTLDVLWFGRNISIFFIQYLGPPPEQLMPLNPVPQVSNVEPKSAEEHTSSNQTRTPIRDAIMLLSFPVAYTILVLPFSIVRSLTFKGHKVGSTTTIFGSTWFALAGFVEVLLFILLKPDFGLQLPQALEALRRPVHRSPPRQDA